MTARSERALLVVAPFVALATVGVGLRLGGPDALPAAIVRAAAPSAADGGLAWQVRAFEDDQGLRTALAGVRLDVAATAAGRSATWSGMTNAEGVAEIDLALSPRPDTFLEVRQGATVLARGIAQAPPDATRSAPTPAWMPFSRRTGSIALDVAVLGQRVAPELPASIWVRATDVRTGAPVDGVVVTPVADPSLTFARPSEKTVEGWTHLVAIPAGLAASLALRGAGAGGLSGEWEGGLYSSPGAPAIDTAPCWDPSREPTFDLTATTPKSPEYVEIDDAVGRVWATSVDLAGELGPTRVAGPRLPPGLYWIVAASDAEGASEMGPGTAVRPFFVAASDHDALALGTDSSVCRPGSRTLWPCLAVAVAHPVPRWTALDGLPAIRAHRRSKRFEGVAVATSALLAAMALESLLVLRALSRRSPILKDDAFGAAVGSNDATSPRADGDAFGATPRRPRRGEALGRVTVGLLVALLGFALLAAFVVRSE